MVGSGSAPGRWPRAGAVRLKAPGGAGQELDGQGNPLRHRLHPELSLRLAEARKVLQGLFDDLKQRLTRVERGKRVLVDKLDFLAQLTASLAAEAVASISSMMTCPLSACSNPSKIRARVVFPEPDSPTSACVLPRLTSNSPDPAPEADDLCPARIVC
jgi:hypothetical protein